MFTIGGFTLTDAEVARRKAYLEIAPEDERRLRDAHEHLQKHAVEIIDKFYEYLFAHEHTRNMLSAPGLVDRLKKLQAQYFSELTSGVYDLAYFENRLRVGLAHERVGLSPEWYLGAYNRYLSIVSDVLSVSYGRDYEKFFQTIVSLTKIIYLDMSLAIDAYIWSAQDKVNKLQVAKKQLTDMIVHDLQNPLAGITAFLQTMSVRSGWTAGEQDALREAMRRCEDLAQMILNVLHVSRAEAGRLETYIENVDLATIASESAAAFRLAAERDGRALTVEAPEAVAIRTDQTLLRRVLGNLIRNALRHTPAGTSVVLKVEDAPARIHVIDEGPGIPQEVQGLLFEAFGAPRLREVGLKVDSGLGLAFCRMATEAVGAKISVASDGRKGTTFSVTFPAANR